MLKYIIILIIGISFVSCKGQKSGSEAVGSSVSTKAASPGPNNDLTNKINIDVAEAKTMLKDRKDIVLIDVRTPGEIAQGKINDALEMDISSPDFQSNLNKLDKNKEYIVYCAVGGRSATAVSAMQQMGFSKVHNLTSGYTGWSQQK